MTKEQDDDYSYEDTFAEYITEKEILDFFGISKPTLYGLRMKHKLPFIAVTTTKRLYYVPAVKEWLLHRSRTI